MYGAAYLRWREEQAAIDLADKAIDEMLDSLDVDMRPFIKGHIRERFRVSNVEPLFQRQIDQAQAQSMLNGLVLGNLI